MDFLLLVKSAYVLAKKDGFDYYDYSHNCPKENT